jgi:hypothetical protein
LNQTTDQTEIRRLQQQINQLEQQLKNLPPPVPHPLPPPVPGQKQLTISYKGSVGDQHEYLNLNNPQERVLIASNNSLLAGTDLTIKGNHYVLNFAEKDIALDPTGRYIIEANNTNFTLTPAYQPPPPQPEPEPGPTPPSPDRQPDDREDGGPNPFPSEEPNSNSSPKRIEGVFYVSYIGEDYITFSTGSKFNNPNAIELSISRKNPQLAGKKIGDGKKESDYAEIPKCRISFLVSSANQLTTNAFGDYVFEEDFNDFELAPLNYY